MAVSINREDSNITPPPNAIILAVRTPLFMKIPLISPMLFRERNFLVTGGELSAAENLEPIDRAWIFALVACTSSGPKP